MATAKRIIVCCDGSWKSALGEPGDYPPSNVARISRLFKPTCSDGTSQIIYYCPGLGSSGSAMDSFTGGNLGYGLDSDMREVYNFICTNYVDGDDIILLGFSRGAFTARSVADMIDAVGLLTHDGLEHFYAVFDDYQHLASTQQHDAKHFLCTGLPSWQGEVGSARVAWETARRQQYRAWLKRTGYTRDTHHDGTAITIRAVAVWETVGSLGIPPAPLLGIRGSARQWEFSNTRVPDRVQNAFQALALDELRAAFRPALWERLPASTANLKQVWFPGDHANVGGGWSDQGIADISLAWMCDQLSSLGLDFSLDSIIKTFMDGLRYAAAHPRPFGSSSSSVGPDFLQPKPMPWANGDIYPAAAIEAWTGSSSADDGNGDGPAGTSDDAVPASLCALYSLAELWETARPWSLALTRQPTSWIQKAAGTARRHPGLFRRVAEQTREETEQPLLNTNERVHSSVRVRLACAGLDLDDSEVWRCKALTGDPDDEDEHAGPLWRLERGSALSDEEDAAVRAYIPRETAQLAYKPDLLYPLAAGDGQWSWLCGGHVSDMAGAEKAQIPQARVMPEEPLVGYWERLLLAMTAGKKDVWRYAEEHPPLLHA